MKKVFLVICLLLLILPAVYGLTAAIGNARVVLRVNATPEDPAIIERTLEVKNKNEIPVKITITPSSDFEKFVDIKDNEFVLQPGESKKAEFTLTIDRGGKIEGKLNVGFSPEDPESGESNVGLASTIIILSDGPIIEDEEEEEEVIEEEEETFEGEYEEESNVSIGFGNKQPPKDDEQVNDTTGPNPLTGILIIAAIVVIGLVLYFAITKLLK